MAYNSYLNMGVAYYRENNLFNAIQAFELAISKERSLLRGLNNIGLTLIELGLQKEAINKLNKSILCYESNRGEFVAEADKQYLNRAKLFRILGKQEEFLNDIKKVTVNKKNSECWIELGLFHLQKAELDKSESAFQTAINIDKTNLSAWLKRALYYQLLGKHEEAINDCKRAYELSVEKTNAISIYHLGKAYYLAGDQKMANHCYNEYRNKSKVKTAVEYKESLFQDGIVLFVDIIKGYGFLIGRSIFNEYDSIYFKIGDCKETPHKGDKVRFKVEYQIHKNQYTVKAKQVEITKIINNPIFFKDRIYHAIISIRQNAFKAATDCKYIELFYPHRIILPYAMISNKIDAKIQNDLSLKGYAFVELTMNIDENYEPNLSYLKTIRLKNTYSNKIVSKKTIWRNTLSSDVVRSCYVCGMEDWCGTDGCPCDPT